MTRGRFRGVSSGNVFRLIAKTQCALPSDKFCSSSILFSVLKRHGEKKETRVRASKMNFDPSALSGLRPRKGGASSAGQTGFKIDMDFNGPTSSSQPPVAPLAPQSHPSGYPVPSRSDESRVPLSGPPAEDVSGGTDYAREGDGSYTIGGAPPAGYPALQHPHQQQQQPSLQYYQETPQMPAGTAGSAGGGYGFEIMGGSLPAGDPRAKPAGRRPNAGAGAANAVNPAMNFSDFNSYPRGGGGGGGGGGSFMLDEDIEAEPRYAREDPSWAGVNSKPSFAFASKATVPTSKGPNAMTTVLLIAVLLAGGLVTFREEIFAFGVSVLSLIHI